MAKYHYEYGWRSIDLCYGGAYRGPFKTLFDAKFYKPSFGIWRLEKRRVYEK